MMNYGPDVFATATAHKLLRMARDLWAKRAIERYLRRRARTARRARHQIFDFLPCCQSLSEIQERVHTLEHHIVRQRSELHRLTLGSEEEKRQLADFVTYLRRLSGVVNGDEDHLPQSNGDVGQQDCRSLEENQKLHSNLLSEHDHWNNEVDRLRKQLRQQVSEETEVLRRLADVQQTCESKRAELATVYREAAAATSAEDPGPMLVLQECNPLHASASRAISLLSKGDLKLPPLPPCDDGEWGLQAKQVGWLRALSRDMSTLSTRIQDLEHLRKGVARVG